MKESFKDKLKEFLLKFALMISAYLAFIGVLILVVTVIGVWREKETAQNRALAYLQDKYEIEPIIISAEKLPGAKRSPENAYLIKMNHNNKDFWVRVNLGDLDGIADDYQFEEILNDFTSDVKRIVGVEPSLFAINYNRESEPLFLSEKVTTSDDVFRFYPVYATFIYHDSNLNVEFFRSGVDALFKEGFISLINFKDYDYRSLIANNRKTYEFKADLKAYGLENLPYIRNGFEIIKEPSLQPMYNSFKPSQIKVHNGISYYIPDPDLNLQFEELSKNANEEILSIEGDARIFKILSKTYRVSLPKKKVYIYFPVSLMKQNNYQDLEVFCIYTPREEVIPTFAPLSSYPLVRKDQGEYYIFKIEQNWQALDFKLIAHDVPENLFVRPEKN